MIPLYVCGYRQIGFMLIKLKLMFVIVFVIDDITFYNFLTLNFFKLTWEVFYLLKIQIYWFGTPHFVLAFMY